MKKVLVTMIAILVLSGSIFAAGVDITGIGSRSTMMAGNYRAVSNDWSGMFWNPAGLVFSKGLKAGISLEFIKPTVGYTPLPLYGQQFSATSAENIENEPKTFLVPAAGVYYSNEKMAFGVGFWAPFGLGAKWDLLNTTAYNSNYPEYDFEDDLKIMVVQPTFAYKLRDNLSVGVGVKLIYADIMIRKPNFSLNPVAFDPAYAQLKAALGAAAQSPFDQVLSEVNLQGDGLGFGANLGLQWKPMETLTLGASLRYYNDVPLDGNFSVDTYYPKDPGNVKPTLDYLKSVGQLDATSYQKLMGLYSGAKAPMYTNIEVKADLPLPMNAGFGIAYTGIKNLLVSADVAMTQWSTWEVIDVFDTDGNQVAYLTENWEDGIRMGVGLEYSLSFAKLYAGFYNEPRAAIDETMQPTIPDVNSRNTVTAGFSLPLGPTQIYFMYEHIFMSDYTVEEWTLDADGTAWDNMAGDYTMNVNNFLIGLDWAF